MHLIKSLRTNIWWNLASCYEKVLVPISHKKTTPSNLFSLCFISCFSLRLFPLLLALLLWRIRIFRREGHLLIISDYNGSCINLLLLLRLNFLLFIFSVLSHHNARGKISSLISKDFSTYYVFWYNRLATSGCFILQFIHTLNCLTRKGKFLLFMQHTWTCLIRLCWGFEEIFFPLFLTMPQPFSYVPAFVSVSRPI